MSKKLQIRIIKFIMLVVIIYFFLLSIKLLGHSFKLFGKGFAESMLQMTSNPFAGLIIGVIATSLIQSSSTTTSIVVGLVAGGALTLNNAIPIVMGANIGTTVTNILVSFGHITRRIEFKKAFSASIVHDFFNVFAVIVLFPIEIHFHIIEKAAILLQKGFANAGGMELFNPLKLILDPVINLMDHLFSFLPHPGIFLMIASLILLFVSLALLVKLIRSMVLSKIETVINQYLFRNDMMGFLMGLSITAIVQSSSVTTSLIIPLAGAGLISIKKVFPYTLGANIGTTVTTILAALALQNDIAVMVAFSHLCFNVFGIAIFYPLRALPIRLAEFVGEKVHGSTKNLIIFIVINVLLFAIPAVFIIFK